MKAIAVTADDLGQWLPEVWPFLAEICRPGYYEPADIVADLEARKRQLWLAHDGKVRAVVLTQVQADRLGTVRVAHVAGDGLAGWLHLWGVIEAWARDMGARRIEAVARPGFERALAPFGMKKTYVTLEKAL
jgi:hypothetical protein